MVLLSCNKAIKNQHKGASQKIYVEIFVCLATYVINLEIVLDVTTDSFVTFLKGFMSRCIKCTILIMLIAVTL